MPTLSQAGVENAEYPTWFGLFAPAKTPRAIVDRLHRETARALQEPKVRERLTALGVDPLIMSSEEFGRFIDKEIAVNAALVKAVGLKAQ